MMKDQHLYIYIYMTEPELTLMTMGCEILGISYLLGQVNEISTETLGSAFLSEISCVARVLLDVPPVHKGNLGQASETYLRASLAVVEKLDRLQPTWRASTNPV